MMSRATLVLAAFVTTLLGAGCFGSDLQRRTADLEDFRSWAGQPSEVQPDSLQPGILRVASTIPEVADGSFQGLEELSMFVQIQNQGFEPTEVSVYASTTQLFSDATVRANATRIARPVLLAAQTAIQIDARNYPQLAEGFEEFDAMVSEGGNIYLYIVAEGTPYRIAANVPSVSMLIAIE